MLLVAVLVARLVETLLKAPVETFVRALVETLVETLVQTTEFGLRHLGQALGVGEGVGGVDRSRRQSPRIAPGRFRLR